MRIWCKAEQFGSNISFCPPDTTASQQSECIKAMYWISFQPTTHKTIFDGIFPSSKSLWLYDWTKNWNGRKWIVHISHWSQICEENFSMKTLILSGRDFLHIRYCNNHNHQGPSKKLYSYGKLYFFHAKNKCYLCDDK